MVGGDSKIGQKWFRNGFFLSKPRHPAVTISAPELNMEAKNFTATNNVKTIDTSILHRKSIISETEASILLQTVKKQVFYFVKQYNEIK